MPNLRTYRTHRISDIILITIESTAQRSTDSPISWDKNLIPPAQTHGRICSSPHQPSHATRNLTTSTCLEEPLRTLQVCHNAHVVELECLAFVEALAEPNGLLVRGLGRDWQISDRLWQRYRQARKRPSLWRGRRTGAIHRSATVRGYKCEVGHEDGRLQR